ncbi:hypothetical protein SAMN02745664_102203 [Moraxella cuniculi DSM 21768]|uniref:Uncharacterized protein n=1 Tax=Moraxella cuniculi DSM 21768 TaxID=1122245 RepID=A0A1N7DXF7_9GAMM|nr:hypothetical protein SAMN02745664_102203 [Moraxella cuniculi DSM 21768]
MSNQAIAHHKGRLMLAYFFTTDIYFYKYLSIIKHIGHKNAQPLMLFVIFAY